MGRARMVSCSCCPCDSDAQLSESASAVLQRTSNSCPAQCFYNEKRAVLVSYPTFFVRLRITQVKMTGQNLLAQESSKLVCEVSGMLREMGSRPDHSQDTMSQ